MYKRQIRINGNFNNSGTVNVGDYPSYFPGAQGILIQQNGDFFSDGVLNFSIDPTNCVISDNHGANGSYSVPGDQNTIRTGLNCTELLLPVKLVSFIGNNYNGVTTLNWVSALELNFNRYEIEKSMNGTTFNQVGAMPGTGAAKYKFDVNQAEPVMYFRLKMVDNDGKIAYSNVIRIEARSVVKDFDFTVTPTVVASNTNYNLIVNAKNYRGVATATIMNNTGAIVGTSKIAITGNTTVTNVNAGSLAKGIYYIRLVAGNNKPATQRLIIQ